MKKGDRVQIHLLTVEVLEINGYLFTGKVVEQKEREENQVLLHNYVGVITTFSTV